MRLLPLAPLALLAAPAPAQPAFEPLDALDARVAAELGPAPPLDRRLRLPRCPEPVLIARIGAAGTLRCPTLGWRVSAPLAGAAAPAVRRGDPVSLTVRGHGFALSTEAVALADAGTDGAVRIKTAAGAVLTARTTAAGSVEASD